MFLFATIPDLELLVLSFQAAALIIAWLCNGRSDRLIYCLTAALFASIAATHTLQGINAHMALAMIDAAIVTSASRSWISDFDLRGWVVGLIGICLIGGRFLWALDESTNIMWHDFSAFWLISSMAFIAQVIIAGGMVDELGWRAANYLRRSGPRRARLLRNVAGR